MLLVHINAFIPQLLLRLLDLLHQLLVCLRNVIEAVHVVAELEEEVCAKGHQSPERKLCVILDWPTGRETDACTYEWNHFCLNDSRQGYQAQGENGVDLSSPIQ